MCSTPPRGPSLTRHVCPVHLNSVWPRHASYRPQASVQHARWAGVQDGGLLPYLYMPADRLRNIMADKHEVAATAAKHRLWRHDKVIDAICRAALQSDLVVCKRYSPITGVGTAGRRATTGSSAMCATRGTASPTRDGGRDLSTPRRRGRAPHTSSSPCRWWRWQ
jgi:hypothetical protein